MATSAQDRVRPKRVMPVSALCALMACVGCGGGGGGGGGGGSGASSDVKSAFPRYSESTRGGYVNTLPGGATRVLHGAVIGTKEVGGKMYSRFGIGETPDAATGSIEVWGNLIDDSAVEAIGGAYTLMAGSVLTLPVHASTTFDEPLVVQLDVPVGEPQSFSVSGMGVIGDPGSPLKPGTVTGKYTLVEEAVAVATPVGTVSGCAHYAIETEVPDLFGAGVPVGVDVWYHPRLGVVKVDLAEPLAGLGLGMAGTSDSVDLPGGYGSVHKLAVLGEGASSNFELSTHDAHQAFDADKNTHAKMLLEVRWVDDAMAKSPQMPYVNQDFGTVFGTYPSSFTQSSISFFFPDEAGQNYTYWVAFVDQAAKNEAQNGIAYHIDANYEPDFSPVRLAARIVYKKISAP